MFRKNHPCLCIGCIGASRLQKDMQDASESPQKRVLRMGRDISPLLVEALFEAILARHSGKHGGLWYPGTVR